MDATRKVKKLESLKIRSLSTNISLLPYTSYTIIINICLFCGGIIIVNKKMKAAVALYIQ